MERMLRYISGTIDKGLIYSHNSVTPADQRRHVIISMFSDSDWAGDIKVSKNPKHRSRVGYLIKFDSCSVHWSSKFRTTGGVENGNTEIDLSSQAAEIGALSEGCRRLIWLKRTFSSAGFEVPMCDVYEDNQAAIRFVQGQTLTERTRHIHREDSAIRELQRNKEINIQYINTAYNLADFFTKILPMTTFRNFRDSTEGPRGSPRTRRIGDYRAKIEDLHAESGGITCGI